MEDLADWFRFDACDWTPLVFSLITSVTNSNDLVVIVSPVLNVSDFMKYYPLISVK